MIIVSYITLVLVVILIGLFWLRYHVQNNPITIISDILYDLTEVPELNRERIINLILEAKLKNKLIKIPLNRIVCGGVTSHVIIMPAEYCELEENDGTFLDPSAILPDMELN